MNQIHKKATYLACSLTRTTNLVSRFTSVTYFLPQLFRLRYANFGGISPDLLWQQMRKCNSFDENIWCLHWNTFAEKHESEANDLLNRDLHTQAISEMQKAIAYYSMSAFPGHTPRRIVAHTKAKELFEKLIPSLSKTYGDITVEKIELDIEQETVIGYLALPNKTERHPMVLVTNGLEGTAPELVFPMKNVINGKMGAFFMEMPGTYQYKKPLDINSSKIYSGVIDYLEAHNNVDSTRIGMAGVSFGAHWSARMAALDSRLQCAASNGGNYTFPRSLHSDILIAAIKKVLGANSISQVIRKLKALSFTHHNDELYRKINIPLLVVNGSQDTLFPTEESVILAEKVSTSTLKLYEGDDHCAMEHYDEMIEYMFQWISDVLLNTDEKQTLAG